MSFFRRRSPGRKVCKRAKPHARRTPWGGRGSLFCEALEDRRLLTVTFNPIVGPDANSAFDVPSGKYLYVPLTASDPGETITYSISSNNADVAASILTGNPTLQLTVQGVRSGGQAFSGTMTIQLFENLSPQTVSIIAGLVESGFYDNLTFYRIVPNFVIQGGANGRKSADNFDDEFNVALTFNSPGLLAMANPGTPDTNDSEIFITDIDLGLGSQPQYLNFRHSIFGQLTSGFDVYNDIMSAEGVDASNSTPTSPVTITSATIITDTQNGVAQISEAAGFTGMATITVTAMSTDGSSSQQTFTINAAPATTVSPSQPILLSPVENVTTPPQTPISFQIAVSQYYTGSVTFSVTGSGSFTAAPANVSVVVTPGASGTATVTLTPAASFTGTVTLVAHADDNSLSVHDAQEFTLTVVALVEIVSVTDPINAENADSVTASGTGQVGALISLVALDETTSGETYTTTVGSDGTWTIVGIDVSALADGTITFTVTSTDGSGDPTESGLTASKDTLAPGLVVEDLTDPINGTNAAAVTASGTGEAGATISIVASDDTTSTTPYTTTVDSSGHWSITGMNTTALADGTITFHITAKDVAGNRTETSATATKDTVAPNVALTLVTDPITIDNSNAVAASGTGEVGATVSVVATDGVHTTVAVTTVVAADGTWSVDGIDVGPLDDGDITYVATATDAAGNRRQSSLVAVKHTVAIVVVTDRVNVANAASTSASGTGEVGAAISLVVTDGAATTDAYTTTVGEDGTWSIDGIDVSGLADGDITFLVTATNEHENSAQTSKTVVKDTVPPTAEILSTTNPINLGNQDATFINGSTEAGATVSVVASDGTHPTASKTTTAGEFGTWSIGEIDVSNLMDGTITYTITVTDTAGNSAQFTKTATKDTVAPSVAITAVTNPVNLTSSGNVSASGTGEVGASISVVVSDGIHTTAPVTTTVASDGTWSIGGIDVSGLLDGTITYTATATDAGLNTAVNSMTATKATVSVTVVTDPINLSNVTNVSVSGTGQVGATVSLVASDGTNSTATVTTTIGANGTWSINGIDLSALNDGTITFTATATDGQGHSAHGSLTALKDTVGPSLAVNFVTNPISASNTATVSGTGDVGALIVLTATDGTKSTTSYSVVVAGDGTWQINNIDCSALGDGTITFTAKSTDALGNTTQRSITATKGSLGPNSLSGRVFIDANENGVYDSGETALAGVILTLNGVDAQGKPIPSQTTTTASDGSYSFADLAAGTYSIAQAQPAKIADGSAIVGSLGGSAGINAVTGIVLTSGGVGSNYNFSELGLDVSMISARMFLASTPPANQILNDAVTQYGLAAPTVTSITKSSSDPTAAASVSYTVTFNESVTGVDAGDFAVYGNANASIESLSGSGGSYTVVVATGGAGSVGLSLVDNDSIVNASGKPLGGPGAGNGNFTGASYTVSGDTASVAINSVTDPINAANQTSVSASGTGTPGAIVTLVASDGSNTTNEYSAAVGSGGTWSMTGIDVSGLADGTITLTVTVKDTGGNTAQNSRTANKDTVAPQVAFSGVTEPINAENASNVAASGTSEVGATISLVAGDGTSSTSAYTTTVGTGGTWSISGIDVGALADGNLTFTVTASDAAGNTAQTSMAASKDTAGPAIQVTNVTDPVTIANIHTAEASGTGEVGAAVSLIVTDGVNTTTAYTTTIGEDGTWTITGIDVSALADGTITYTATATDAAGNSAASSLTATKVTVVISSVTDPINAANATNVAATGTGQPGASITLVAGDGENTTSEYTTTVAEDGTWTLTGIDVSALADGTITFTVTAMDSEGNTAQSSLTALKDTVAPEVAISGVTDPINAANATDVTASGTGEVGATITVVAGDGESTTGVYTTTVGGDGTWAITGIDVSALADGTIAFTVTAADAAGNTTVVSLEATKDTIPPAVTLIDVTSPITIANHRDTTVGGTGEAGATITVVASDGIHTTTEYTTIIGEDGSWTITGIDVSGLADGTITFTITATDAAGNPAQTSTTVTKTTVAVTSALDPVNAENATSATISGKGEAGATITLVASDGVSSTTEYTTTIGEDGTWTIGAIDLSALADGTITYTVTATDAGGNTAEVSHSVTKDSIAPAVALQSVTDPINAANATGVTVSGTGEVGATITLVATDGTTSTDAYTTTVAEDGTWTFTGIDTSGLADGIVTFTVAASDAAGNIAETSGGAIKDTVAPAVAVTSLNTPITIASQHVTAASGTGEVGATITLVATDGTTSTVAYTTTVDEDGNWSITGIDVSGLADGTITYTATASDEAGNTAQHSLDTAKVTVAITAITEPINAQTAMDVTVSGTGEAGAVVSLVASDGNDTSSVYTTTISEDGSWSIAGIDLSALADGTIVFAGTAEDALGNLAIVTYSVIKDTMAPQVAVTSVTDPINADHANDVAASGTGEAGATITLVASDGTASTDTYTTTVAEDGTWTITGVDTSGLADGIVTFTVTAGDAAGNSAETSGGAIKDTLPPDVSIAAVTDPINSDNASDGSISGTGEVGSTITVVVSDGVATTSEYTTTIGEDGTWTIADIDTSGLADGAVTYMVTATDAAGNTTASSLTATKGDEPTTEPFTESEGSPWPSPEELVDEALTGEDFWL